MNILQPGPDVDDSGQNGYQVGNALQATGNVSSASQEIPHGTNSGLRKESILTKNIDHMPTDQNGIETGTGHQATLDLNELPANSIFDQCKPPPIYSVEFNANDRFSYHAYGAAILRG
jgi:hypothetical protein